MSVATKSEEKTVVPEEAHSRTPRDLAGKAWSDLIGVSNLLEAVLIVLEKKEEWPAYETVKVALNKVEIARDACDSIELALSVGAAGAAKKAVEV